MMSIKIFPTTLLLSLLILLGCNNSLEDEKIESNEAAIEQFLRTNNLPYTKTNGVYHAIRNKGFGYNITDGDSISFWYVGYTLKGVVFDTNVLDVALEQGIDTSIRKFNPIEVIAGSGNLVEGLKRGLLLCRMNEIATILFHSSLGYGGDQVGTVSPWSPLAFDIYPVSVKNSKIYQEQNIISNFVAQNDGFLPDSTGLWVKNITHNQDGIKPFVGDTLYGWLRGERLNGLLIEELSSDNQDIIIGNSNLVEALTYGFLLMKTGEHIKIVVPSFLGYGIEGNEIIDPYTPLIYELKLDSIK